MSDGIARSRILALVLGREGFTAVDAYRPGAVLVGDPTFAIWTRISDESQAAFLPGSDILTCIIFATLFVDVGHSNLGFHACHGDGGAHHWHGRALTGDHVAVIDRIEIVEAVLVIVGDGGLARFAVRRIVADAVAVEVVNGVMPVGTGFSFELTDESLGGRNLAVKFGLERLEVGDCIPLVATMDRSIFGGSGCGGPPGRRP